MIYRLAAKLSELLFIWRNLRQLSDMRCFSTFQIGEFVFRGFARSDTKQVKKIYTQLNNGARFSLLRVIFFHLFGNRLLLLASNNTDSEKTVVGMNMYYFNSRDGKEKTIHEGFIGVMPEASGQGIATQMRNIAKAHFASLGIKGISTRISLNNPASLRSAQKIGFEPVERYRDPQTHEERYYMICKLEET